MAKFVTIGYGDEAIAMAFKAPCAVAHGVVEVSPLLES